MIKNKSDLHHYIECDRMANGQSPQRSMSESVKDIFFTNIITYLHDLRCAEYYNNVKTTFGYLWRTYYPLKLRKYSREMGFQIGLNSCGPSLSLPHYGTIIISAEARLGANCRVHACVNIGRSGGQKKALQIGDNVYIGPRCVLFGDIHIPNNVTIGANDTVNKSFVEENVVIAGTPAVIVKRNCPNWVEFNKNS